MFLPVLAIALISLHAAAPSDPQANVPAETVDNAPFSSGPGLGFAAGGSSGIGLAYRQHFDNGFGVGVAAIGWGDANNVFVNVGATAMYTFARSWLARFYGLVGGMAIVTNTSQYFGCELPTNEPCNPVEQRVTRLQLNAGPGVGMELHFTDHIGLAFELPVAVWLPITADGVQTDGIMVLPVPNAAFTYYF